MLWRKPWSEASSAWGELRTPPLYTRAPREQIGKCQSTLIKQSLR